VALSSRSISWDAGNAAAGVFSADCLFVIYTHRANIARMAGAPRAGRGDYGCSIAGGLTPLRLLALLADGQPHSGRVLAQRLGVTRSPSERRLVCAIGMRPAPCGVAGYALAGP